MNKIVQLWLNSPLLSNKQKQEIRNLSDKEIDVFFASTNQVFGTAGVRGIMGMGTQKMNRFTYTNLAYAYGQYLYETYGDNASIVIGYDNRINSKKFAKLCAMVISSFKIRVLLFKKLMPTPIISYAIRQTASVGGLIITASHNPKQYNGFKAYHNDGGQILPDVVKKITKHLKPAQEILNIQYEPIKDYVKYINKEVIAKYMHDIQSVLVNKNVINDKKDFPIVFTGHHGTACKLLPSFLRSLNFNIYAVRKQCYYNSSFKNSPAPNPENEKSFDLAIEQAKTINSKIIIGVDPDADRMAIMINHNNQWRLMSGNEMGIIYTYYVLHNKQFKKQPYIISSYVSTNLIDRIAKEFNAQVYRTGTGFKWMGAKITEVGASQEFVVAFEEAIGALNSTINRDKDSFGSSALALEIYDSYRERNMDFIDILEKEIYPKYGWWFGKTVSFTFDDLDWQKIVKAKMDLVKNYKEKTIGNYKIKNIKWNVDGDCLDWILENDSWIRFRVSGTEPKFKIYYNLYGKNQNELSKNYDELHKKFCELLK